MSLTISTTTPPPILEIIAFEGTGNKATDVFTLKKGISIFHVIYDGFDHFAIWLYNDRGSLVEVLVNRMGSFAESKTIEVTD